MYKVNNEKLKDSEGWIYKNTVGKEDDGDSRKWYILKDSISHQGMVCLLAIFYVSAHCHLSSTCDSISALNSLAVSIVITNYRI